MHIFVLIVSKYGCSSFQIKLFEGDGMQNNINIIYPKTLGYASPEALALCEIVISNLLKVDAKELCCKVDISSGYVDCNVTEIKSLLTILLKTKKMEEFYNQFIQLLHKSNNVADSMILGRLELIQDKLLINFLIKEEECFPDF